MKRIYALLLCVLLMAFAAPAWSQEEDEPLDVGVKIFKMGRSIVNWWQPFEWGQNFHPNLIIADYLSRGLTNSPRWNCVARAELDDVLDEQNLDNSGLIRSETAAEYGAN